MGAERTRSRRALSLSATLPPFVLTGFPLRSVSTKLAGETTGSLSRLGRDVDSPDGFFGLGVVVEGIAGTAGVRSGSAASGTLLAVDAKRIESGSSSSI